MKKSRLLGIACTCFVTLPILIFLLFSGAASAAPLAGILHFYAPDNGGYIDICLPENGFCQDPVTYEPDNSISGDYDSSAGTLTFSPILMAGAGLNAISVELLPEGTHVRTDEFGYTDSVTVEPGQVGAYVIFEWPLGGHPFSAFMVWDVTGVEYSPTFTPADSDNDGIPGHAMTAGPLASLTLIYEFTVSPLGLTLDVTDGLVHECTSPAGATIEVTADVDLASGLVLDSITWTINGVASGTGTSITPQVGLGTHTISATALSTTGESDTQSVTVEVTDTVAPVLNVAFVDSRSGESISLIEKSGVQWVEAHLTATDVCDDNPITEGVGGFALQHGDLLKVQGNNEAVTLTASELELSATATDASGNLTNKSVILHIID